jgi:diguanylate cyclase (GGDEF)-like protein/PAS domain S-box-containing protein
MSVRRPFQSARSAVIAGVAILVLLASVAALFERFIADEDAALNELVVAARLHRLLDETVQLVLEAQSADRGYAVTGDRSFLAPVERARDGLPDRIDELGVLLATRHHSSETTELREAVEGSASWTAETISMTERGDLDGARGRIATHEGMRRMARVEAIAREVRETEDARVERLLERVRTSRVRVHIAFGAVVLIAVVLATLAAFGLRRDMELLHAAARATDESERRFRAVAEAATDLVRIHALDGTTEYASPSSERLLGYRPQELLAQPPFHLVPERDRDHLRAALARSLEVGEAAEPIRHRLRRQDGVERTYETRIDVVRDELGRPTRYHTIGRDVTERALEEQRLTLRATKDALTGLLNAGAFTEAATALLARCEAEGQSALLAFCDVNGLKVINDTLGHDAGDGAIVDAARLLEATARGSDLVGRLGGDEFAVLGAVTDEAGSQAFGQRLRARVDAHNASEQRRYRLSLSVGTAAFTPGSGQTLDALRAVADAAMYRHKGAKRGAPTTTSGEGFVRPVPR